MVDRKPRWVVATVLVACALAATSARPQDAAPSTSPARSKAMRDLARAVALKAGPSGAAVPVLDEPIYRFDDPARSFSDGSVWAFGKPGRPAALLGFALQKGAGGRPQWLHEIVSLADAPITAAGGAGAVEWAWEPKRPGLALKPLPDSPAPADEEPKRLRQMREAARRFKAFELLQSSTDAEPNRYELRLLPQPVHRYGDATTGPDDGAIFLMCFDRNPELVLLIEARREGRGGPSWHYGLARLSAARLRVSLDDREVADLPRPPVFDPAEPYYLFIRPADGL